VYLQIPGGHRRVLPRRALVLKLMYPKSCQTRVTGGVTHTAVCAKHWDYISEGDVDPMRPPSWLLLGLA